MNLDRFFARGSALEASRQQAKSIHENNMNTGSTLMGLRPQSASTWFLYWVRFVVVIYESTPPNFQDFSSRPSEYKTGKSVSVFIFNT